MKSVSKRFLPHVVSAASFVLLLGLAAFSVLAAGKETLKLAESVTIYRDSYGVPHVYGKTDASAVFGLMYAQAEDNFWQLEEDHINKLGRASEVYGVSRLSGDMMARLFETDKKAQEEYARLTPEIRALCDAYAAGLNYYLERHPEIKPRLITRYEPWFPLITGAPGTGSLGITQSEVRALFPELASAQSQNSISEGEETEENLQNIGSNMWAISPKKSASGKALLFINPHVQFFGGGQRYEAHLNSKQGLNISGFAMLGMPYIWTGFNKNLGWSQTNTYADSTDVYIENFDDPNNPLAYRVGDKRLTATEWTDEVAVNNNGVMEKRKFTFRKTHHGPVVALRNGKMLSVQAASMQVGGKLFAQKWAMARAGNLKEFKNALSVRALTGSNTIYADNKGNIFYLHGNAMPRRNPQYDWSRAVDGSDPQTEWKGYHEIDELPQVLNPSAGFVQNCNSTPFLTSASDNPEKSKFPAYMAPDSDTLRSQRSRQILSSKDKFTFDEWIRATLDTHLLLAETLIPELISISRELNQKSPEQAAKFSEPLNVLRSWDYKSGVDSVPTTLFMMYFEQLQRANQEARRSDNNLSAAKTLPEQIKELSAEVKLTAFEKALDGLKTDFGDWRVVWGEINRLQRVHTSGSQERFDDSKASVPIPGANGQTGSIFTFGTRREAGQKRRYGVSGNSYLAVVEFAPRVKARSLLVFGQKADPQSKHFFDQANLYSKQQYKSAWFELKEIKQNSARSYKPGEEKVFNSQ